MCLTSRENSTDLTVIRKHSGYLNHLMRVIPSSISICSGISSGIIGTNKNGYLRRQVCKIISNTLSPGSIKIGKEILLEKKDWQMLIIILDLHTLRA